jgi:IclR helix-turn-helix domain
MNHIRASLVRKSAVSLQAPGRERTYLVPVLVKAIKIIELMNASDQPLKIEEITHRLGYSKSTVYRIVRTLCVYSSLQRKSTGRYSFRNGNGNGNGNADGAGLQHETSLDHLV